MLDRPVLLRALGAAAVAAALSGCASPLPHKPPPPDPPGDFVTLTRPVIAVGDTQEHEAAGFPLHDNSSAVDAYVEVTQRPPEQPLFGRHVLEWALQAHSREFVIHLGDVLDLSCESELARMDHILESSRPFTVILPGNHDGLMFGIFNYNVFEAALDPDAQKWDLGCRRAGRDGGSDPGPSARGAAVTRREFIVDYIARLARDPRLGATLPLPPKDPDVRFSWRSPSPDAFLDGMEARLVEGRDFGRSFLAQNFRLPATEQAPRRVRIIGLDTNQVGAVVGALDTVRGLSPGSIGHVYQEQLDAVAPWVEEARRNGDIVVFAGHHNWARISWGSQARIAQLARELDHPLVYISAHTHRGFWALHPVAGRKLLELNVSSLSDWPIAYRRIAFGYDRERNRIKVMGDLMPRLAAPAQSDQDLLSAWKAAACARSGVNQGHIEKEDLAIVQEQRAARGSLMDWVYQGFGEWCESCLKELYDGAHRYHDEMLEVVDELYRDLGDTEQAELERGKRPQGCAGLSIPACIASLKAEQPGDVKSSIELYRRKALLVDDLQQRLDRLE